mgnify:CR=1 FL=1
MFDLFDQRTTLSTRFSAAPVYPVVLLEVAGLARGVDEIAQGAASKLNGFGQGRADFFDKSCAARQTEFSCGELRSDAGAEQGLVGVDVAYADHDAVVHDALFDADSAPARCLVKIAGIEAK